MALAPEVRGTAPPDILTGGVGEGGGHRDGKIQVVVEISKGDWKISGGGVGG